MKRLIKFCGWAVVGPEKYIGGPGPPRSPLLATCLGATAIRGHLRHYIYIYIYSFSRTLVTGTKTRKMKIRLLYASDD